MKAQALAKGEDIDGDLPLLDVLGTLHKFAGLKLSPEAFVEAPGAATTAPLFDFIIPENHP